MYQCNFVLVCTIIYLYILKLDVQACTNMRYIEVYADYALTRFLTMWINPAERSDPIKKLPKRIFTQELIGATCVHTPPPPVRTIPLAQPLVKMSTDIFGLDPISKDLLCPLITITILLLLLSIPNVHLICQVTTYLFNFFSALSRAKKREVYQVRFSSLKT